MAGTAGRRGSVRRDRCGTYSFCVDVTEAGAETRRQLRRHGFASAKEARAALTAVLVELDAGSYVAPDRTTTLAAYVEGTWLPMLATRNRKPSTVESYRRNLRVHILPRLGRRPLCEVKTAELDRLYADLLAGAGGRRPLSPRTVRYVHTILHGIFAHAIRKDVLTVHFDNNYCRRDRRGFWTVTDCVGSSRPNSLHGMGRSGLETLGGTDAP